MIPGMDPISNPYAPGAGTPPPELAGRDELLENIRVAVQRTKRGLPAKSAILTGLRGVGKTVLLDPVCGKMPMAQASIRCVSRHPKDALFPRCSLRSCG